MGKRKLGIYGDADLDPEIESYLKQHKWLSYVGARERQVAGRDDSHHYSEAFKLGRVLVTHDDGYINNRKYPIQETHGVIILRQRSLDYVAVSMERFLRWYWEPMYRHQRGVLGFMKVDLSADGFHYWGRTPQRAER